MSFEIKKAGRKKLKLKVGLQGASGSGKTLSALKLAHGIEKDWTKICVIDSENESSSYYAPQYNEDQTKIIELGGPGKDIGEFNSINLLPPFTPESYIEAIDACIKAGMTVAIIDSVSHEWDGKGGCLEIHQEIYSAMKYPNSFTAWKDVTPRHNKFIDHMRNSPIHIIGCTRAKQDYVLNQNDSGKSIPQKVGLKGVQRDGLDYEYGLMFTIDADHYAFAEKDRTGLFANKPKHIITEETGKTLIDWANGGADELYIGDTAQMKMLAALLKTKFDVTEKSHMREIHDHLVEVGCPMDQMSEKIDEYIKGCSLA